VGVKEEDMIAAGTWVDESMAEIRAFDICLTSRIFKSCQL
jgi:hypothetical protein